jgi:uncharacterized protein
VEVEVLVSKQESLLEPIQSHIDREKGILMGRLTKDVDLLEGIVEACRKHGVQAGSVSCIGSLRKVTYVQVSLEGGKMDYTAPITWESPVELLSGTGFVGNGMNGELDIHFHGTYVNHKGEISGGHFLIGKNPTAVTVEFIVHFTDSIALKRETDAVWGLPVFQFDRKGDE